jgi:hypothetical protein
MASRDGRMTLSLVQTSRVERYRSPGDRSKPGASFATVAEARGSPAASKRRVKPALYRP